MFVCLDVSVLRLYLLFCLRDCFGGYYGWLFAIGLLVLIVSGLFCNGLLVFVVCAIVCVLCLCFGVWYWFCLVFVYWLCFVMLMFVCYVVTLVFGLWLLDCLDAFCCVLFA